MTNQRLAHAFALLGVLSSACGGADEPPPATATTAEGQEAPPPTTTQTAPPPTTEAGPAARVSDAEVAAFSSLHADLMTLQQQATLQVQQGEAADQVQAQVDEQVTALFQNSSLTPERYEEIAQRANTNDALRERIERELAATQPPPGGAAGPGAAP